MEYTRVGPNYAWQNVCCEQWDQEVEWGDASALSTKCSRFNSQHLQVVQRNILVGWTLVSHSWWYRIRWIKGHCKTASHVLCSKTAEPHWSIWLAIIACSLGWANTLPKSCLHAANHTLQAGNGHWSHYLKHIVWPSVRAPQLCNALPGEVLPGLFVTSSTPCSQDNGLLGLLWDMILLHGYLCWHRKVLLLSFTVFYFWCYWTLFMFIVALKWIMNSLGVPV